MFANKLFNLKWFAILLVVIFLIGGGVFVYLSFSTKQKDNKPQVNVTLDRIAIIQRVQDLSTLETVDQTIQRDIEVVVDAGSLNFFSFPLLQNTRTQKIAVTGVVTAGIDLGAIEQKSVTVEGDKLTINAPAPRILNVDIIEDKTSLIKDDLTLLFQFQDNINGERRRDLNELLLRQVIKQAKQAVVEAACKDDVLQKAGENSKPVIINFLNTTGYKNVVVTYTNPQTCSYEAY